MGLANAIQTGDTKEIAELAAFLNSEFDFREKGGDPSGDPVPVSAASLESALKAWAYMQLNARDQGD